MSRELAFVPYTLFHFGLSVLSLLGSHCDTQMALITTTLSHLMPQTDKTMGPHLSHCNPGINLTVSQREYDSQATSQGVTPPQKQPITWEQLLLFPLIALPHTREAKQVNWISFLYKYGPLWYAKSSVTSQLRCMPHSKLTFFQTRENLGMFS